MAVIDVQVHAYERNHPGRPWAGHPHGPASPERFRVVKPIDPANPAVDDVLADWAKTKGAVGVRLMLREEQISDPGDPRLNRAFAAAGRHGFDHCTSGGSRRCRRRR